MNVHTCINCAFYFALGPESHGWSPHYQRGGKPSLVSVSRLSLGTVSCIFKVVIEVRIIGAHVIWYKVLYSDESGVTMLSVRK